MTQHSWFVVAVVLFIIAGVYAIVESSRVAPRWLLSPTLILCAGLACFAYGFVVAT